MMDQNHTKLPGECGQVIQTQTTKLFNSKATAWPEVLRKESMLFCTESMLFCTETK